MADPLSTAVAIGGLISLADLVLARGFKCLKYLRQVKNAEKEVSKLLDETSSVSGLFSWVLKEIEEAQVKSTDGVELEIRQYVNRCHETLEKFQAWLMRFSKESSIHVAEDEGGAAPPKKSKWMWPFSTKEVTDMTAELQRHKADVVIALSTDNWINAKASLGLQREIVDSLTDIRTLVTRNLSVVEAQGSAKETKMLLDWLTTYDPTESHQNAQEDHQEGTGEWILEQPEYKEWIASSSAGLWLYGIAGAGKTVLASVIIENLFKTVPQGVAYYYCSYKNSVSQEARNVLGSLCRQLVLQNLDCLKDLDDLYKKHHPKGSPPKPLREEALGMFLQDISSRFECATVVVDGLDECGAAAGIDRSRLVQVLSNLHTDEASRVRLLVSSRKELDIEQAFRDKFASVPIAAKPADLRLYVRAEVAKRRSGLRFGTVEVREQVIETLIEKADGM
ncbi:hypothetical protein CONLIGDRAFT_636747 [Coniochaeta ligniaria NRRL 30616]|uniref:Nephrocystin 3-like N-terminal domain-containing protein n=1 Tax=Coniochaeta ligniaria NRRL 30616 TaxID=1408157 RepID=A0A1J7J636_9PEZI|nr:hypothetical protein CONLIGDRAFT_636747 [Coniochaeta ligniaria NRRL 30616]